MKNFLIDMMMAVKQSPSSIFLENIYQSQRHIDLWISLHDSDSGWVGPDKGPFNRRRTPLCRSGAAVVNTRANGVLQILSQPMSMEVVTGQRSKRCCTLHADVLNFCTIISDVRCKFLHLGRFIPHICHEHHKWRSCKIFLAGVNFYRFNAKNWHFRKILCEKVAFFFTDLTQKIGVFQCEFYSPKILPV